MYDTKRRPTLDPRSNPLCPVTIGTDCPGCHISLLATPIEEFAELPDGSATGRCGRCKAALRQNAEGFVFLKE